MGFLVRGVEKVTEGNKVPGEHLTRCSFFKVKTMSSQTRHKQGIYLFINQHSQDNQSKPAAGGGVQKQLIALESLAR